MVKPAAEAAPEHTPMMGNTWRAVGDNGRAMACYQAALVLNPEYADARCNLALLQLAMGLYDLGWKNYVARHHPTMARPLVRRPSLPYPGWWGGEGDLAPGCAFRGKSVVVWPEQGLGDEIQFCRFLPTLKAMGVGAVTLVCKDPLYHPIFLS